MTLSTAIKLSKELTLVAQDNSTRLFNILKDEGVVGTVTFRNTVGLSTSILDDVMEDEMDFMYPAFRKLQEENAYYLDEIIIQEEKRGQGIGQKVVQYLFEQNRPILLYSLADAETFWEKMNFKNLCGYYYVWTPSKEAFY